MKKQWLLVSLITVLNTTVFASFHVEHDLLHHLTPTKIMPVLSNNNSEQMTQEDQLSVNTKNHPEALIKENVGEYKDRNGRAYSFEWIGNEHYLEPIFDIIDRNYIQREPVSRQLGLNHSANYKSLIKKNIIDSFKKNLVLVAKHQGEIVACSVNNDYFEDILNESDDVEADDLKIFSAFFDELENPFIRQISPIKEKDIFYSNMGCVEQKYLGNGLSTQLAKRFTSKASELGYKYIMAILTSEQTQHTLIKKLNYKLVSEISYKDFKYENQKPFILADANARCVLAVKKLTHTAKL